MARVATLLLALLALAVAGCGEQQRQRGLVEQQRLGGPEDELEQLERRHRRPGGRSRRDDQDEVHPVHPQDPGREGRPDGQLGQRGRRRPQRHRAVRRHVQGSDFGQGGTYTFKPTKAGTIAYVCTIHPGMTGTLNVTG